MHVMILGASGYLGTKVKECLKQAGYEVTGVYRTISADRDAKREYRIRADLEEIQAELTRGKYDWIINCAAVYERGDTSVHEVVDANLIFALRVLNCAVEAGVKNFLTIDTSLPANLNLYSFTKKSFAEFGKLYAEKYRINFVNVILEMFYGEDEPENRFLIHCCKAMRAGEELRLTAGTQKRDIIYIEDVCQAIEVLLNAPIAGYVDVPLGSGEAVSVRAMLEYMHKVLASESKLLFGAVPMRENEPDCVADLSLLKGYGYEVKYPWMRGIEYLCEKIGEREKQNE